MPVFIVGSPAHPGDKGLDIERLSPASGEDILLKGAYTAAEGPLEADTQQQPRFLGFRLQVSHILGLDGQRLFAQHMGAMSESGPYLFNMELYRRSNTDQLGRMLCIELVQCIV